MRTQTQRTVSCRERVAQTGTPWRTLPWRVSTAVMMPSDVREYVICDAESLDTATGDEVPRAGTDTRLSLRSTRLRIVPSRAGDGSGHDYADTAGTWALLWYRR